MTGEGPGDAAGEDEPKRGGAARALWRIELASFVTSLLKSPKNNDLGM
jgi:hypothetical protein